MKAPNKILGSATSALMVLGQIATIGVIPIAAPAAAQSRDARPVTINCQSVNNRSNSCRLPNNAESVRFAGNNNRCREGVTWRRVGNNLNVSGGCGGQFEVTVRNPGGSVGAPGWGGGGNSNPGWGGGSGGGNPGWGGGGNQQGFAGEITCRSRDNREEQCSARTQGRVELIQRYSSAPCVEGQTWRATNNSIIVRNGCQARFAYGRGNWNGGGGSNPGWGNNGGFAGQLECRSNDNRQRRCPANTANRVELLAQFSSTQCVRGRNWGYDRNSIWVDNGCQARFGFGNGNVQGDTSTGGGGGNNTGAIIGGAAIAAGLIAIIAAANKGSNNSRTAEATSTTPATLDADLNRFSAQSRAAGEICLQEAQRQVGSTGGTRVRLDQVDSTQASGNGWIVLAKLTGTWPDFTRNLAMDCRTSGTTITGFDVR